MPPVSLPKPTIADPKKSSFIASRVEALRSTSVDVRFRAAGEVLRRSGYAGAELTAEAERVLGDVRCGAAAELVRGIDASACSEALLSAASAAFECAFAESEAEKTEHERAAVDALLQRDAVESTLFAARRRANGAAKDEVETLMSAVREAERALEAVDACLSTSVGRKLTGINETRRGCLREMNGDARDRARWFSCWVDDDDMLLALSGEKTTDLSIGASAALRASPLPAFAARHDRAAYVGAEASALGRVVAGKASAAERTFLASRAKRDASLAEALRQAEAPLPDDEPASV